MLTPQELRARAMNFATAFELTDSEIGMDTPTKEGFIYGYTLGYYDAHAELTKLPRTPFQSPSEESGRPSIP